MAANGGSGKPLCRGCATHIEQGSIVQFGNGMWHLACFNCVKCQNNIEPDSNLLLLSDGSPLCSDCSQHCSVCNLPISDEAVMTADQCYHAKCFKCTKCNNKIEGSLFARTSSGIYCMSCYAERREAQKKKGHAPNASKSSNGVKEKSLPSLPVEALFELGAEETERPNSAGPESTNFKGLTPPVTSHAHSASTTKVSNLRTNMGSIPEQPAVNDMARKPTMVRKNTAEKVAGEQTYSQAHVDGLKADIKTLQRQLADSEFNYSKLKLHNDQVTERIKVFQEEFSSEISRRKAAESQLTRVENQLARAESENKTNLNTILDLTRRISELDAELAGMHEQHKVASSLNSPTRVSRNAPSRRSMTEDGELRMGSALRASISSDTSLKARLSTVRRSLDVRPNEEGFLTLPSGKRISMDDLSIPESTSIPPSPPTSADRDAKSGKRFWKMPFKTSPRPGEMLKAQISSPKHPGDSFKAQISSPKGPSESFARAMDSPKSNIPAIFASLDAPMGDSHAFLPHPYLRPVRCDACKEKMWGLQARELRCTACGFHCHVKCAAGAPYDCPGPGREYPRLADNLLAGRTSSPPLESQGLFGVELAQQLVAEGDSSIPRIVEQCVKAVEERAMTMEGIYRKSGPQTVMKSLRSQLSEGPVDLDMEEFSDITAVTSVLKLYFRELPIPLFTYEYYDAWLQASATPESERVEAYAMVLGALPPAYRRTLTFFIDHLHRIYLQQKTNLMSSKNIGVVFGPTLLRCQDDLRDFDDMAKKNAAVDSLIQVWAQVKEIDPSEIPQSDPQ